MRVIVWSRRILSAIALLALSTTVAAQTARSASIAGTITDESRAGIPGVTVTVTSPALQVPQLLAISDDRGEYQFVDLSPGTYRVAYELAGFSRLIREDIRLTTGFAARVDVVLTVAAVAETITVTGQSPLVDVTNTRGGATVTKEVLTAVPNNMTHQDVMLLAGGVSSTVAPLAGQTGIVVTGSNNANRTYGQTVRMNNSIEGIKAMPGESPDFAASEEVDVKTFGNTADVDLPGALIQFVFKSGGNQFHGRYVARAQNHVFQSTNLDAALRAQGVTEGDAVRYYTDLFGDIGGRIVPNKLWFYVSRRDLRNERSALGYARDPGVDGVYGTADDTPGFPPSRGKNTVTKLSYQVADKHKLIAFWARNPLDDPDSVYGRFTPFESTQPYNQVNRQAKVEWQGVLTDRLLANVMFGDAGYTATRAVQPTAVAIPNRLNRETGYQTGAAFFATRGRRRPWREQGSGSVSYYPARSFAGSHEITAGFRLLWGRFETDLPNYPNAERLDYRLVYDRVGGVPNQPVELNVLSYPVQGLSRNNVHSGYLSDSWRPAKRLTVNIGLRFERIEVWVPSQVKEQGRFGTAGTFPQVDVGTWNTLAPRVGAAFDVSGDGKLVAKGTYGQYHHSEFNTGVPLTWQDVYNKNGVTTYAYRWRDQDRNNDYTPGEVNLDPNGADFLTVTGATNTLVNPDLKVPRTHEVTASLERQLLGTLSLRGLYVYTKVVDQAVTSVNVLRPYSVWNQRFTRRDPGPDGVLSTGDDGGPVTFYDFDPAYRGSNFVASVLTNGRSDSFQNAEIALNKRPGTGKWFANTSLLVTKNHRWLTSVAQSPNDDFFPLDETWDITYRLAGGYRMPLGINVATLYQAYRGAPGQRTVLFRPADPDLGPSLPSSGSITLRMEPYGAQRGPNRHIVNLRASKDFPLGGSRKLTLDVDALNAFNSNVPWGGINYAAGPTFGYLTSIVSPRALQLGVSFEF